ncbi:uncharacterized protein LOC116851998 [Odontomachus brunneus]|uniref:uncharacterized protein LOC116851998 n=1 Tax=Odontomachus brunneus TaxID=486640 RepID=UPI0013F27B6F|nr:uncharacterized protein LOC116851998 [Odontomachus brunneus]
MTTMNKSRCGRGGRNRTCVHKLTFLSTSITVRCRLWGELADFVQYPKQLLSRGRSPRSSRLSAVGKTRILNGNEENKRKQKSMSELRESPRDENHSKDHTS